MYLFWFVIRYYVSVYDDELLMSLFVFLTRSDLKDETDSDVLISGQSSRNRAVHGDVVVVEVLPRTQWQGRSMNIKVEEDATGE